MDYVPLVATNMLLTIPATWRAMGCYNCRMFFVVLQSCTETATKVSMPTLLLMLAWEDGVVLRKDALLLILSIDSDLFVILDMYSHLSPPP